MPGSLRTDDGYSSTTGVIFLFNLIVGTGALALPGALQKSGYILGIVLLLVLAFFSFVTVTFIVESLAGANALSRNICDDNQSLVEETPLVQQDYQDSNIFEIKEKYEIGQMGVLISPKWCQVLIYVCLCIYLFGDLAIYAVVIGRCGSYILCSYTRNFTYTSPAIDDLPCWENHSISRINVYRVIVFSFLISLGPFVFFNLQKTKLLQIITITLRWLAFFVMMIWSSYKLWKSGPMGNPPVADLNTMPTLFGTLVYSFMCQHSLPGLLQPIKNKNQLKLIIGIDFILVSVFYIALAMTGIFTFLKVQDIYTLNFWEESNVIESTMFMKILSYFLGLFPVFAVSTNFPIIAITLRNNLRNLFLRDAPFCWYYDRLVFPLIAILPPIILALIVSNLQCLVGIIGSYAGTGVQYLIPCLLVQFTRSRTKDFQVSNIHSSPFKSIFWIYAVYVWMIISLVLITINYLFTNQ